MKKENLYNGYGVEFENDLILLYVRYWKIWLVERSVLVGGFLR